MREPTVTERIAAGLAQRIVTGEIPPGTRLRQEAVAHEHQASQAPVREAFLRLEAQRLLISRPRQGYVVPPIAAGDEREIVAMRGALEVMAVRQIRGRPARAALAALQAALEAGVAATDLVGWDAANRAFHTELARLSGMPRLIDAIAALNVAWSRHVFSRTHDAGWTPRSNHDHQRIVDAVARGDTEAAAGLLDAHLWAAERMRARSVPA